MVATCPVASFANISAAVTDAFVSVYIAVTEAVKSRALQTATTHREDSEIRPIS